MGLGLSHAGSFGAAGLRQRTREAVCPIAVRPFSNDFYSLGRSSKKGAEESYL